MNPGDRFTTREKNKRMLLKNKGFLFHSLSFPHLNAFMSQIFYNLILNGNKIFIAYYSIQNYKNKYIKIYCIWISPNSLFPVELSSLYSARSIDSISTDSK